MFKCYVSISVKTDASIESVWVEIMDWKEKLILGILHRPLNLNNKTVSLYCRIQVRFLDIKVYTLWVIFVIAGVLAGILSVAGDAESDQFIDVV